MKDLQLNDEEKKLIKVLRNNASTSIGGALLDSLAYLIPTIIVFGLGFLYKSAIPFLLGYLALLFLKLIEIFQQPKHMKSFLGIVEKYEYLIEKVSRNSKTQMNVK